MKIKALIVTLFLITSLNVTHAAMPHETFVFESTPSADQIAEWSTLPGTRSYVLQMYSPTSEDLRLLSSLRGADHITVEVTTFPDASTASEWKRLARLGVELVGLDVQLPNDEEIKYLNAIEFSKIHLVLTYIPSEEDGRRLAQLKAPLSLSFALGMYPRYLDKPQFLAIPSNIPLRFSADYWPWYTHMDLFNLLPHTKRLRVEGTFPSDQHLDYLHHIKSLDHVTIETDFDPSEPEVWRKLKAVPVKWVSKDHVPSASALSAFEASAMGTYGQASRKLTIDQEAPLTAEELSRLSRSPISVEWVHLAPTSYMSRKRH